MGTPTAAFVTAATTKLRRVVGAATLKNWTSKRDKTIDAEVVEITEEVVTDAAHEVASALGNLEETDIVAIGLAVRLAIARFTGEYSQSYSSDQQATEARVTSAIDKERLRRIHSSPSSLVAESTHRPRPDYSKEHPTNTKFNG